MAEHREADEEVRERRATSPTASSRLAICRPMRRKTAFSSTKVTLDQLIFSERREGPSAAPAPGGRGGSRRHDGQHPGGHDLLGGDVGEVGSHERQGGVRRDLGDEAAPDGPDDEVGEDPDRDTSHRRDEEVDATDTIVTSGGAFSTAVAGTRRAR